MSISSKKSSYSLLEILNIYHANYET
uniref:Uncharacterized protein n=1 Tax=Nelumbo nucifera TaxID=4432 RepID=A0A822XGB3_NELNU|nr:TPA_asm: hypothetical protein HUJ06_019604 [Nelumbo nucifera]